MIGFAVCLVLLALCCPAALASLIVVNGVGVVEDELEFREALLRPDVSTIAINENISLSASHWPSQGAGVVSLQRALTIQPYSLGRRSGFWIDGGAIGRGAVSCYAPSKFCHDLKGCMGTQTMNACHLEL